MASSYDEAAREVFKDLEDSGVSQSTRDAIRELVESSDSSTIPLYTPGESVPDGVQVIKVTEDLTSPIEGVKAIVMDANTSASVTFGADSTVEILSLGVGDNNVVFEGDKNITIEMTGGDDSVSTGAGEDTFVYNGGTASINSGEGNDTIRIEEGTEGDSVTADAGDGFDTLVYNGNDNHTFRYDPNTGKFHMNSIPIEMTGVDVVVRDIDGDGTIVRDVDKITVLATNQLDSIAAKLYKIVLGRDAIDDAETSPDGDVLDGLDYWMHRFDQITSVKGEGAEKNLVNEFLACDEPMSILDGKDDDGFVNQLFINLENGGGVIGKTADDYKAALEAKEMDWADVVLDIATSVTIVGEDGMPYVIDGFTAE